MRSVAREQEGWAPITTIAQHAGVDVAQLRAAIGDDDRASPLDDPLARDLLAALDATPFSPPAPDSPALVRALVRAGALVDLDGVIFTSAALDQARRCIAEAVLARGEMTVSELRELLGTTRKYMLPLVNRMDAEGVTKRRGDVRVPGPRAAEVR